MADKQNDRNFDPETTDSNVENANAHEEKFNAGGNDSDYDGGHPEDAERESDERIQNGEEYARRQHGKDEIGEESYNAGGNDSDYDGGHPEDSEGDSEGKIEAEKKNN